MKTLFGIVLVAGLLACPLATQATPRQPLPPLPERSLSHWGFDERLPGLHDRRTLVGVESAQFAESWSGYSLVRGTGPLVPVAIPAIDPASGQTNLACDFGSIRFWFRAGVGNASDASQAMAPDTATAFPTVAGTGTESVSRTSGAPAYRRLLESVSLLAAVPQTQWSLYYDTVTLYLSAQTATGAADVLQVDAPFPDGLWHLLLLTYTPTNTVLYIDGTRAAEGTALVPVPPASRPLLGLVIGSDVLGANGADGQFEELTTFAFPYDTRQLTTYYHTRRGLAALGPLDTPDVERARSFALGIASTAARTGAVTAETDQVTFNGPQPDGDGPSPLSFSTDGLWLEVPTNGFAANLLTVILHNTAPDQPYDVLTKQSLLDADWAVEQTILGATGDSTTMSLPMNGRTNLFIWARFAGDSDSSGLPDWWQIKYFGALGVDPYADPDGDGWSNLQEYQNGTNPNAFNTPPPPSGFSAVLDPSGTSATLTWDPPPGPVLNYVIKRAYSAGAANFSPIATIGAPACLFQDSDHPNVQDPDGGYLTQSYVIQNSVYRIQAVYAGGVSPAVDAVLNGGDPTLSLDARLVRNSTGHWQLICASIPAGVSQLRLSWFAWNYFYDFGYFLDSELIAVTNFTAGIFVLPNEIITNHLNVSSPKWYPDWGPGNSGEYLCIQGIRSSGTAGPAVNAGMVSEDAPYFVDGREHLKQNLLFLLRAATISNSCAVSDDSVRWDLGYYESVVIPSGTDYVESSIFHWTVQEKGYGWGESTSCNYIQLNNLWPFTVNYQLHGRLFDPYYIGQPSFQWVPSFATIPSPPVLGLSDPYWILQDLNNLTDCAAGVSGNTVFLQNGAHNCFGLSFATALINPWLDANTGLPTFVPFTTLDPGSSISLTSMCVFYNQTTDPVLQNAGYYFAPVYSPGTELPGYPPYVGGFRAAEDQPYPLPVNAGFSATNQTPLTLVPFGQTTIIGCWQKFQLANGYAGKHAYLGQYFTNAFRVAADGNLTSEPTGVLSPYGEFFPTEPGPVALVTLPDIDTGERGTGIVHVIKLQLDANHDGVMDTSYGGPDITTPGRPFRFWANNDCDWATYPGYPNFDPGSDKELTLRYSDQFLKDYLNFNPRSVRDLEDYARLWICGVPALTNGNYSVTLNWANVSGSPAINLLRSVEPDGGTRYLTDANIVGITNIVWRQIDGYIGGHKYQLPTTSTLTLPGAWFTNADNKYLLFEGAGIGSGELVLTISQNGTNVLARTSAWLDLRDVRDLYERVVVTNTTTGGITNWSSAIQTIEYPKVLMDDDTNIIVFVHGINNTVPNWLISSDTMFKRLYWAGYRGKFASLRWPCKYLPWNTFHPFNFNLSEFYGYKSGAALRDYLNQLRQVRFPNYQLHICAHSQGGAVASDAISRYGAPFDTLVLSQAAMPASGYDIEAPTVPDLLTNELFEPTPQWQPMGYRGIYTNIAGRVVNFFNANDYALGIWVVDQKLSKPDGLPGARNYTSDGTNGYAIIDIGLYRLVTDSQECRGMVARSRTLAIGAQGPVSGQTTQGVVDEAIDLKTQFGFFDTRPEHSAQFTRPIQTVRTYYQQLLRSCQLQPAP